MANERLNDFEPYDQAQVDADARNQAEYLLSVVIGLRDAWQQMPDSAAQYAGGTVDWSKMYFEARGKLVQTIARGL